MALTRRLVGKRISPNRNNGRLVPAGVVAGGRRKDG